MVGVGSVDRRGGGGGGWGEGEEEEEVGIVC